MGWVDAGEGRVYMVTVDLGSEKGVGNSCTAWA